MCAELVPKSRQRQELLVNSCLEAHRGGLDSNGSVLHVGGYKTLQ